MLLQKFSQRCSCSTEDQPGRVLLADGWTRGPMSNNAQPNIKLIAQGALWCPRAGGLYRAHSAPEKDWISHTFRLQMPYPCVTHVAAVSLSITKLILVHPIQNRQGSFLYDWWLLSKSVSELSLKCQLSIEFNSPERTQSSLLYEVCLKANPSIFVASLACATLFEPTLSTHNHRPRSRLTIRIDFVQGLPYSRAEKNKCA